MNPADAEQPRDESPRPRLRSRAPVGHRAFCLQHGLSRPSACGRSAIFLRRAMEKRCVYL
jgi:hypothetical protein